MFLLLNIVMLCAVVVMRLAIKRMPNLIVKENLVLIHVLLFTAVTVLWVVWHTITTKTFNTNHAYFEDPTDENYFAWFYTSYDRLIPLLAYRIANTLLNLFMLYMLHSFSIFEGFVYDPITGDKIPVLSMFQTATAMEKSMKDRVLSDRQRAQIKLLVDYEEAQELFAANDSSASITGSFVANDLGESMRSLRHYDEYTEAVHSDADSEGNEDDI